MSYKRNKGFLIPSIINPPQRKCVQVWIPDEPTHIANFWGVLNFLTLWTEYERTGDTRGIETADVWKGVYLTAREYFEVGECQLPIELRNNNGTIEWRADPLAGWISLGDACPCPSPYAEPSYNPDSPTFEARSCAIAVGLITWIMDKLGDSLDLIEASTDTVGAMDSILAIFPPAYLVVDALLDMIVEVVEATVAQVAAYDTVERREAYAEWLYCRMASTGELSAEIWNDFKQAVLDEELGAMTPAGLATYAYLTTFETDAILARARIESYGDQNCAAFDCDTWTHVFDFRTGLHGWVIDGAVGVNNVVPGHWVETVGIVSDYVGLIAAGGTNYRELVAIHRDVVPDSELVSITVESSIANTTGTIVNRFRTYLNGSFTEHVVGSTGGSWTSPGETVDFLTWSLHEQKAVAFPSQGSELVLIRMIVSGTGVNPFL